MKASNFKGANVTFAEDQKQYNSLPALTFRDDQEGKVITCWKLNFWERLRVLWTGKIWHSQMTFNSPLQPINKTTKRTDFFTYGKRKTYDKSEK